MLESLTVDWNRARSAAVDAAGIDAPIDMPVCLCAWLSVSAPDTSVAVSIKSLLRQILELPEATVVLDGIER